MVRLLLHVMVISNPSTSVLTCPKGYPSLAAFLDSDENFMVYRRFGYVQSRLLLEKQDDLRKLETKLDKYDKQVQRTNPINLMTHDLSEEDAEPRRAITEKLEKTFCEYGWFILILKFENFGNVQRAEQLYENFLANSSRITGVGPLWITTKNRRPRKVET